MRRLAADLGVQPSALYWHYPNKQTLLAELADRIVHRGAAEQSTAGWDERVRQEALALRGALLAYRDSAEIVSSSLALGLGENPAHRRLRGAFEGGPFDPATVASAAATMLHFVLGHVSLEQQRSHYDRLGALEGRTVPLEASEGDFLFGVDTIIAGLRQRAASAAEALGG
ncbi:TetR/AcrR family transcriptional regulator C-terminal domain-containing protein [Arenivirga flava]